MAWSQPGVTRSRFMSPWGDFKPIQVTVGRIQADRVTKIGLKSPQGDFKQFQVENDPMSLSEYSTSPVSRGSVFMTRPEIGKLRCNQH
ncbi:hypothetical protein DPMN_122314 [Dreissena polymorpha]|uniref:Uncharacterized protein n=1 Tax=Dreissena polymorpha TaxID=45954 RepID=A0A9D4GP57_DREPO|nr:hypothetical protein DPMN_122314 [Dreissena polymorpha]